LLELDPNVVFLEVDESHVATAKFHFEFPVRGFGTNLREG
jgi:hypothetical protein